MAEKKKEMKNCPYCGEEILMGAVKCRYCKSYLSEEPPVPLSGPGEETSQPDSSAPPTPVSAGQGPPPNPPVGSDRQRFADGQGTPPPPRPDQFPGSGYAYPRAGVGRRILAYIIDGIIAGLPLMLLIPLGIIPYLTYTAVPGQLNGPSAEGLNVVAVAFMVIIFIVGGLWGLFYFLLRDGFGAGQSWGKRICGLMVVNLENNSPCDKGKSFVRNIVLWLLNALAGLSIVELIVLLVHDRGHRLGDMLAKTQVIDVEQYRG